MYFDTHAHAHFDAFAGDNDGVVKRALDAGVWLANVGTSYSTSKRVAEMAAQYDEGVYATIGIHPTHTWTVAPDEDEGDIKEIQKFDEKEFAALINGKVVAVGEIGLDYYRMPPENEQGKKMQKSAFVKQLHFAQNSGLPIVIHCRDAYEDTLDILKNEYKGTGILHSFTDTWETAKKFLDLDFYVALNGIFTFDKTGKLSEVCKNLPSDRILSETDAPYLAPEPYRGKKNEPAYVKCIVQKMAEERGISEQAMADITFKNALSIYGLK